MPPALYGALSIKTQSQPSSAAVVSTWLSGLALPPAAVLTSSRVIPHFVYCQSPRAGSAASMSAPMAKSVLRIFVNLLKRCLNHLANRRRLSSRRPYAAGCGRFVASSLRAVPRRSLLGLTALRLSGPGLPMALMPCPLRPLPAGERRRSSGPGALRLRSRRFGNRLVSVDHETDPPPRIAIL